MNTKKMLACAITVGLMAACGGGSTGVTQSRLLAAPAPSGLPYADNDSTDALGQLPSAASFEVTMVGYRYVGGETDLTTTRNTETADVFFDGVERFGDLPYEGGKVQFLFAGPSGDRPTTISSFGNELPTGETLSLGVGEFTQYAQAYRIGTYQPNEDFADGEVSSQSTFIIGLETQPDTVAGLSGSANYFGIFEIVTAIDDSRNSSVQTNFDAEGRILLEVSFDDMTVSGVMAGSFDFDDAADFVGEFEDAAIAENGFEAPLAITCLDRFTCTSASEVEGKFYGPNAEEAVGLIKLDVNGTDSEGNTRRIVGGGVIDTSR